MEIENILPYDEGNYHIEAKPINNKSWREAQDIEVLISLIVGNEKRIFKGVATNTAIVKI